MQNDERPPRSTVQKLHEAGVRVVLVGGLALIAHGVSPDLTNANFALTPHPQNLEQLASFLRAQHARPLGFPSATAFTARPEHLERGRLRFLILKADLGTIDILPLPDGIDLFAGLWERAVEMDLGGFTVRVASLEDLAAMKRAANRPKDQLHLMEIAALIRLRDETNP